MVSALALWTVALGRADGTLPRLEMAANDARKAPGPQKSGTQTPNSGD